METDPNLSAIVFGLRAKLARICFTVADALDATSTATRCLNTMPARLLAEDRAAVEATIEEALRIVSSRAAGRLYSTAELEVVGALDYALQRVRES